MATSVPPKATPQQAAKRTIVRTPGDSSAPSRPLTWRSVSGRQARTGALAAKASVPAPPAAAATTRAAVGETVADTRATMSGPTRKKISCSDASSA